MRTLYASKSDKELRVLFSKKYVRLQKVINANSWWDTREREMLESTMKQIEVELNYRASRVILL